MIPFPADRRVVQAMKRINDSDDLNPFVQYLETCLTDGAVSLESEPDVMAIHRLQGSALTIRELVNHIRKAEKALRNT